MAGALRLAFAWLAILFLWWAYRFVSGLPGAVGAFQTGLGTDQTSVLMPLIRWHVLNTALAFIAVMLAMTSIAEFMRRSQRLPQLAIALNAVVVMALAFDAALSNSAAAIAESDLQPARKLLLLIVGGAMGCGWIAYFAVSKKVKAVFTR